MSGDEGLTGNGSGQHLDWFRPEHVQAFLDEAGVDLDWFAREFAALLDTPSTEPKKRVTFRFFGSKPLTTYLPIWAVELLDDIVIETDAKSRTETLQSGLLLFLVLYAWAWKKEGGNPIKKYRTQAISEKLHTLKDLNNALELLLIIEDNIRLWLPSGGADHIVKSLKMLRNAIEGQQDKDLRHIMVKQLVERWEIIPVAAAYVASHHPDGLGLQAMVERWEHEALAE
jgi:hypothetical protein